MKEGGIWEEVQEAKRNRRASFPNVRADVDLQTLGVCTDMPIPTAARV